MEVTTSESQVTCRDKLEASDLPESNISPQCSVMVLPDEVFTIIIDILAADAADEPGRAKTDELIRQLSSVSRRFRSAVVNTVSLWTKITNEYVSSEGFERRIARTKQAPLALNFELQRGMAGRDDIQRLKKVLPLQDRWKHLRVDLSESTGWKLNYVRLLSAEFKQLQTASLLFDATQAYDSSLLLPWSVPNIRSLELLGTIPRVDTCASFQRLECLKFSSWGEDPTLDGAFISRLLDLLRFAPNLQKLSLGMPRIDDPPDTATPVTLPALTGLYLTNFDEEQDRMEYQGSARHLALILQHLAIQNLRDFRLSVYFITEEEILEWIELVLPLRSVLQVTTSLSVFCPFALSDDTFIHLLSLFPNVHTLEWLVPGFAQTLHCLHESGHPGLQLNQLRTIVLHNDDQHNLSNGINPMSEVMENCEGLVVSFRRGLSDALVESILWSLDMDVDPAENDDPDSDLSPTPFDSNLDLSPIPSDSNLDWSTIPSDSNLDWSTNYSGFGVWD